MCKVLKIPRATYYRLLKTKEKVVDIILENQVVLIFKNSKHIYGTRKIKVELAKAGRIVSRRKISKIMNKYGLVSKYTLTTIKPSKSKTNNEVIESTVNRDFDIMEVSEVIVGD